MRLKNFRATQQVVSVGSGIAQRVRATLAQVEKAGKAIKDRVDGHDDNFQDVRDQIIELRQRVSALERGASS